MTNSINSCLKCREMNARYFLFSGGNVAQDTKPREKIKSDYEYEEID